MPPGYSRAPYDVSVAPFPAGLSSPAVWTTVPGSCTGDHPENVTFPRGATHGSFVCVDSVQIVELEQAFPPAAPTPPPPPPPSYHSLRSLSAAAVRANITLCARHCANTGYASLMTHGPNDQPDSTFAIVPAQDAVRNGPSGHNFDAGAISFNSFNYPGSFWAADSSSGCR